MILKALNVYYIMALSKRDFKPCMKIEQSSSWFCIFLFFKLPPKATESMNLMLSFLQKKERMIFNKTIYDIGTKTLFGAWSSAYQKLRWKMLRHDSESSRRLLYSGIVKTWFKAILENKKQPSWFRRLFLFSKTAAGGQTKPWNLCFLSSKTWKNDLQKSNIWRWDRNSMSEVFRP